MMEVMCVRKVALVAAVAVCLHGAQAVAQQVIRIDGSSTVYPITEAVAEEFQKANPGMKVTVGISGTGGGFKKFVRGDIDISDASRPILAKEMEEAKNNGIEYIELPVAFDALTVMINPKNTFAETMTVEDLKKIWAPEAQGKIMSWNQVRPEWPNQPLKLYGAGADSGTFDYFTEAIVGKAKSSRGDFTASEDDNVLVQGIASDPNALGFFGYAYYAENKDKLKAVAISHKGAPGVLPSAETVIKGTYTPLSRPIFIYVNKKSLERPEVKTFADFYLKNVAAMATEVKYVPLPDEVYKKATERLAAREAGTVFGGHAEVGMPIEELFKRELTREAKPAGGKMP